MTHSDPRELLANIVKILKSLKIPYIVTGGIAVLVWGRPRFTADIDIVIELGVKKIDQLEEALRAIGKAGYVDHDAILDAVARCGEFNFIDGETGVKVDFWILKHDEFDASRLRRKRIKKIGGNAVAFSSPEDLILVKLGWLAASDSSKQAEDIESILKISGEKLDMRYLQRMACSLRLEKQLNRFL